MIHVVGNRLIQRTALNLPGSAGGINDFTGESVAPSAGTSVSMPEKNTVDGLNDFDGTAVTNNPTETFDKSLVKDQTPQNQAGTSGTGDFGAFGPTEVDKTPPAAVAQGGTDYNTNRDSDAEVGKPAPGSTEQPTGPASEAVATEPSKDTKEPASAQEAPAAPAAPASQEAPAVATSATDATGGGSASANPPIQVGEQQDLGAWDPKGPDLSAPTSFFKPKANFNRVDLRKLANSDNLQELFKK